MYSDRFLFKSSSIHYFHFGNGPRVCLCLHGYGEDGSGFSLLEKTDEEYTFICPDLPYHGATEWREGLDLSPEELAGICRGIISAVRPACSSVTLVGFSLGGRMALQLYTLAPADYQRVVLLAPDGLKVNSWYWLATRSYLGNRLFRLTMHKPGWFLGLIHGLNRLAVINPSIYKFVCHYIHDKEVRTALYNRWTTFRHIKAPLAEIKSQVRKYATPFRLVYGSYDRIILPVRGEKFRKGIESFCDIRVIPGGHQLLRERHREDILDALRH